jgi:hypothetical protein
VNWRSGGRGRCRWRSKRSGGRRCGPRYRWRHCHGPRYRRRRCWARRRRNRFLLLSNGSQHISGTGDVGQINLGLDFFFAAQWTRRLRAGRRRFGRAAQVDPHFFRFVILDRTGMGLLLRHPDGCQRVENGFALHFQLSGEIVNSNLAHPAFLVLRVALKSLQPHGAQRPAFARP